MNRVQGMVEFRLAVVSGKNSGLKKNAVDNKHDLVIKSRTVKVFDRELHYENPLRLRVQAFGAGLQ